MKKRILSLLLAVGMALLLPAFAFAAESEQSAEIGSPSGLLRETDGSLLITDLYNKVIWKQKDGSLAKIAGTIGARDAAGVPTGGYQDGASTQAQFLSPWGIAKYRDGYAISDTENHVIRFLQGDKVLTAAGSGSAGSVNGQGIQASFSRPTGVAAGENGVLYIADTDNHRIRQMDANGNVTTYAGSSEGCADGSLSAAKFREPTGLYFVDGVLYVADSGNHRICKIENDVVTTLAGGNQEKTGEAFYQGGYLDGAASEALFANPQGLAVSGQTVYVADTGNSCIRKIEEGKVSTLLGGTAEESKENLVSPRGIAADGNHLIVSDFFTHTIFSVSIDPKGNIPNEEKPSVPETPTTPSTPEDTTYTVQKGDTLWGISRRFHCTIGDIVSWNRIPNPNLIFPGQVLSLHTSAAVTK